MNDPNAGTTPATELSALPLDRLVTVIQASDDLTELSTTEATQLAKYIHQQRSRTCYPVNPPGIWGAFLDWHCESCRDPHCAH